MVVNRLSVYCLLAGCSVLAAEQPVSTVVSETHRQPLPQVPLQEQGKGPAVIFIGGFGDEISMIMPHAMLRMPALADGPETRAYYHWHAGQPADIEQGATEICSHIAAYRRNNPGADVVLIGHSMGASMALRVAHLLNPEDGAVYVMTLDPADRSYTPRRPDAVNWWGNAYVTNSLSGNDYIAVMGGRWKSCRQADINLRFDGRKRDEAGLHYIHDNALSLLLSRGAKQGVSLYETLRNVLITRERANTPKVGGSTDK